MAIALATLGRVKVCVGCSQHPASSRAILFHIYLNSKVSCFQPFSLEFSVLMYVCKLSDLCVNNNNRHKYYKYIFVCKYLLLLIFQCFYFIFFSDELGV